MADFKFALAELEAIHEERDVDLLWKTVKDLNNLADGLKTDLKKGLSNEEIQNKFEARRRVYGVNVMPQPPLRSFWELVFEGLQDSTLIMLMVSAVISLTLGIWENPEHGWIEGTAILIAVFLVVMVASGNDYQKERQFRKLNEKKENKLIQIIRDGDKTETSIYEINVGDIVTISTGDILCADGVLIEGSNLKCDNSTLTGESMDVKVNASNPLLFAGCQVSEGVGKMVVITVGPHSTAGRLMETLQTRGGDTPLQEKLESLANDKIATIGLAAAGLILVCLTIKLIVKIYWYDLPVSWHILSEIVKYFITSVTIVVVAVPEGLPLAVTIALAYSMLQMVKDQNLVRHLAACETMGGATTICSDKTGTLTKNLMTVTKGWVTDKIFDKVEQLSSFNLSQETSIALHHGININCTAFLGKQNNEFLGNKTECALLGFSRKLGGKYDELQDSIEVVKKFPFSSKVKSMSTLVKTKDGYRMYSKGASEIMRLKCSHWIDASGKILPIDDKFGKHIDDVIVQLASEGLRTILLAYRDFSESEFKSIDLEADEPPQDNYICVGITGIKDPLRDEVKDAVKQCQNAGIVVRMVTGDNILTAKKIAEEAGILTSDGVAIEGPNFRKLSESEMDKIIPNLQVMARSSPTDKYILVKRLKHLGQIVAVTGDGTNDAPALKEADVGFSMGIAGTEVAKEASDIILMDDNFSSIVKAVSWGRNVFDSIRKFLQFQLTVNVVAVSLAFIGAITSETGESPLKPVQLLWVNLIMDTMAALALATDVPTPELLQRKPYGKNANLITKSMWLNIIGQATFQLVVNLVVLYLGHIIFGVEKDGIMHKTLIFNIFVLCQVVNEINCRKLGNDTRVFSGFFTNQICVAVLVFTLAVQWLIIEFGGEFASTTPLSLFQWIECIFVACLGFPVMFAIRSVPVPIDDEGESSDSQQAKENPKSESTDESPSSSSMNRWKKVREQAVVQQVVSHMKKTTITESLRRRRKIDTPGFD